MGFCRSPCLCFSRALLAAAEAPTTTLPPAPPARSSMAPFRPSIAVVVGVLTTMFSITFLLLLYAKHCKRGNGVTSSSSAFPAVSSSSARRHSGVDRAVIELLPLFRFGALTGEKDGLECAVCLSRFEPAEALRLLPKCRHAFHVECVDTWLDAHSTCPLCRVRVDPEDVLLVFDDPKRELVPSEPIRSSKAAEDAITSFVRRISGRHSSAGEKSTDLLQIITQRSDPAEQRSRRSVDCGALRRNGQAPTRASRKDGMLPTAAEEEEERVGKEEFERRFSHRIVVGGGDGIQERWSDLRPSDLLFLRTEMIITDSGRFYASRWGRASRSSPSGGRVINNTRSMSEITGVSRLPQSATPRRQEEERRTMRRWVGFAARRTAQWLSRRGPSG